MTTTDDVAAAQKAAKEAAESAKKAQAEADQAKKQAAIETKNDKKLQRENEASSRRSLTPEPAVEIPSGDGQTKRKDAGDWAML